MGMFHISSPALNPSKAFFYRGTVRGEELYYESSGWHFLCRVSYENHGGCLDGGDPNRRHAHCRTRFRRSYTTFSYPCIWLLIALQGVHSIERTAQEDSLLVLFNTAISNLVRYSICIVIIVIHGFFRFFFATILRYLEISLAFSNLSNHRQQSLTQLPIRRSSSLRLWS